jgi:hypothetical protein
MPSTGWLLAAALLSGIGIGWQVHDWKTDAGRLEALETALQDAKELRGKVDTLNADLAAARAAQKPKDRIITKEVVRYETVVPADRRCTLDGAWRVLHDAAATGDPAAGSIAATTAAPVTDADALETVAENYELCRSWRADLIGWQRFWATLQGQ